MLYLFERHRHRQKRKKERERESKLLSAGLLPQMATRSRTEADRSCENEGTKHAGRLLLLAGHWQAAVLGVNWHIYRMLLWQVAALPVPPCQPRIRVLLFI